MTAIADLKILVVSHAGIRQINRAVYAELQKKIRNVRIVIPDAIVSTSGNVFTHEPQATGDPDIIPLQLQGMNPRTYLYDGLTEMLDRYAPDVVILENDPVSKLAMTIASWCKKKKSKLICQTYENTRRGIISTLRERGWKSVPKNLAIYLLNLWMSKRVSALLVVNRESEAIFTNFGYDHVNKIPLGYDRKIFYPDESIRKGTRAKLNISNDTTLIAYFGRMSSQKGVHLLLEALANLKELPWKLLLDHAFDPQNSYSSYIHSLIEKNGMANRVLFFEANHYEIANYMRAADIMTAPSVSTPEFKEQYGRAVQEAMACGCLCLVSDSGHLPDLVAQENLVFKENDVNALQVILERWLKDNTLMQTTREALAQRAATELTTEKQAEGVFRLIEQLNQAGSR